MNDRWFRLNATFDESTWLADLPPLPRLIWPLILGHVKIHGTKGVCKAPNLPRWCAGRDVPIEAVEQLIAAAVADGALVIAGGTWEIAHWGFYQNEDATTNERSKRYRERVKKESDGKRHAVTEGDAPIQEPAPDAEHVTEHHAIVTRDDVTITDATERHALDRDRDRDRDRDKERESECAKRQSEKPPNRSSFQPPTEREVFDVMTATCGVAQTEAQTEAKKFIAYYESNGWRVGRGPMANWKAAVTGWVTRFREAKANTSRRAPPSPRMNAGDVQRTAEEALEGFHWKE